MSRNKEKQERKRERGHVKEDMDKSTGVKRKRDKLWRGKGKRAGGGGNSSGMRDSVVG